MHSEPTPFIDDDDQAYLYWGNPGCFYVKLNEDMISYSGKVMEIKQDEESFGGPKDTVNGVQYTDLYEEGPWFYKRDCSIPRMAKLSPRFRPQRRHCGKRVLWNLNAK